MKKKIVGAICLKSALSASLHNRQSRIQNTDRGHCSQVVSRQWVASSSVLFSPTFRHSHPPAFQPSFLRTVTDFYILLYSTVTVTVSPVKYNTIHITQHIWHMSSFWTPEGKGSKIATLRLTFLALFGKIWTIFVVVFSHQPCGISTVALKLQVEIQETGPLFLAARPTPLLFHSVQGLHKTSLVGLLQHGCSVRGCTYITSY